MSVDVVDALSRNERFYEDVVHKAYADGDVPGVSVVRLEQEWPVLDYLLTLGRDVNNDPLAWVLFAPEDGSERAERGFFTLLDCDKVAQVNGALQQVDREFLEMRLDVDAMDDAEVKGDYEDGALDDYILPSIETLKNFYRAAVDAEEVVLQLDGEF